MARRMLGDRSDAEDAVQETWLRLARTESSVENLGGWLTRVLSRVCIDLLRVRVARPVGPYDDVVVVLDGGQRPLAEPGGPSGEAELADSVSLGLLVVLEALGPEERLSFVLHDLFGVPFDEIGSILGRSPDAAKMVASRARRKVRRPISRTVDVATGRAPRAVVDAFFSAARQGDFRGLLSLLDPEVRLISDSADGVVVTLGSTQVATRAQSSAGRAPDLLSVLVDGLPGVLARDEDGRPLSLLVFTVEQGRIMQILVLSRPSPAGPAFSAKSMSRSKLQATAGVCGAGSDHGARRWSVLSGHREIQGVGN